MISEGARRAGEDKRVLDDIADGQSKILAGITAASDTEESLRGLADAWASYGLRNMRCEGLRLALNIAKACADMANFLENPNGE